MFKLLLEPHKVHPWVQQDGLRIRGWYEYEKAIYRDEAPGNSWRDCNTPEQLSSLLGGMNGNYSLLLETDARLFAAVDRITSYPLYYTRDAENNLCVSDSLQAIKKIRPCVIDEPAREELLACGYILGRKTIYKDVCQLQGGQMLVYDKKTDTCTIQDYFLHTHSQVSQETPEELCRRLDEVVLRVFQRMIDSIQGKTIALFLSGGYDSRLVATTLKRLNYTNVICITLGGQSTKDAVVGHQIAETLGFPLIKLADDKKTWKRLRSSGVLAKCFSALSAHGALPHLHGCLLKEAIDAGKVPKNCVAVTGYSGDLVEGDDVTHRFHPGKTYSAEEVADAIAFYHFCLNGVNASNKLLARFDLTPYSVICGKSQNFSDEEAEEIVEFYNWRERQCKYPLNDARSYDEVLGIEWRFPLWDHEFVDFWLSVPYDLRYDRKLYYQYVGHEQLPTANNPTLVRKGINAVKKTTGSALRFLYLPKCLWNYFFSTHMYFSPFGMITFPELCEVLKTTKGYGKPHLEAIIRLFLSYL